MFCWACMVNLTSHHHYPKKKIAIIYLYTLAHLNKWIRLSNKGSAINSLTLKGSVSICIIWIRTVLIVWFHYLHLHFYDFLFIGFTLFSINRLKALHKMHYSCFKVAIISNQYCTIAYIYTHRLHVWIIPTIFLQRKHYKRS